jgi:drug/metabolite transporter (DMT)-like permease
MLLKHWKYVLVTGFFGIFLFHTTSYQALDATTALNVGFINSVAPIVIVAMSWAVLSERLRLQQWIGVLLSIVGVLTIVVRGDPGVLLGLEFNRGDLWSAGGMPAWGLFTILLYRRPAALDPLAFVGAIVCVGTLLLLPWFLAEPLWDGSMIYSPVTLGAALYIGVVPSALANVLWNRAVPLVGANTSGLFLHLIPAFTTLMAILFLGELPRWFHGVAIVLIVTGIWLTTTGRRPPVATAPAPAE